MALIFCLLFGNIMSFFSISNLPALPAQRETEGAMEVSGEACHGYDVTLCLVHCHVIPAEVC